MKIPDIFSYPFAKESLLGGLHLEKTVGSATRQKQQKGDDEKAKLFLDDMWNLSSLDRKLGQGSFQKRVANATISIGEAALLSGIPLQALTSAAQNVFKLQDVNSFPLLQLIELASRETVAAFLFPWRESYQDCVRSYIQDWIEGEYQQVILDLCAPYFAMNRDEAKSFEVSIHILVRYFNMNPSEQNQSETGDEAETNKSLSLATDNPQATMIPRCLWEGKRAPAVRGDMRNAGYDDSIIARVLYEWCGQDDTTIGKILFIPNPIHPDRGNSDSAHRRRSQALRQRACSSIISPS